MFQFHDSSNFAAFPKKNDCTYVYICVLPNREHFIMVSSSGLPCDILKQSQIK